MQLARVLECMSCMNPTEEALRLIKCKPQSLRRDKPDYSHATIQRQKEELCSQGEQLIEKSVSLIDIGVSLGILQSCPRLRQTLTIAQAGFRFQRGYQTLADVEDEVEEHLT